MFSKIWVIWEQGYCVCGFRSWSWNYKLLLWKLDTLTFIHRILLTLREYILIKKVGLYEFLQFSVMKIEMYETSKKKSETNGSILRNKFFTFWQKQCPNKLRSSRKNCFSVCTDLRASFYSVIFSNFFQSTNLIPRSDLADFTYN